MIWIKSHSRYHTSSVIYLHDNTSLTSSLFIKVPVLSQESERSCICVLGVSNFLIFTIWLLKFGSVPTVWYHLFVHFIIGCEKTIMMMYRLLLLTAGFKLNHKKCGCAPSSVIKIVKMKYNRIDIKNTPWHTCTSRTRYFITTLFHSCVYFVLFQLKALIKQNHTIYM